MFRSRFRKSLKPVGGIALLLAFPAWAPPATAWAGVYTDDLEFESGTLLNLHHDVTGQLQLTTQFSTFPLMWVANGGEDTVSKIDTDTGAELARYRTWFSPAGRLNRHSAWSGAAPSRTAVDADGNVYVANRHFSHAHPAEVIKILATGGIDRNGDGIIQTSEDTNGDGVIQPSEMLDLIDSNGNGRIDDSEIRDERIAWVSRVGSSHGLGRSLSIDRDGNIWLGLYNTREYYKLQGSDGAILGGPYTTGSNQPYGSLVDSNGILWSATLSYTIAKIDTNNPTNVSNFSAPHTAGYGIALGNDMVYLAERSYPRGFTRFDPATNTWWKPSYNGIRALGISVDQNGDIIVGGSQPSGANRGASKLRPDGSVIWSAPHQGGGWGENRGAIVDRNNDVWVIDRARNAVAKYRGTDGAPLGVFPVGYQPYTYSDATGLSVQQQNPTGKLTVVEDGGVAAMDWGTVSWNSEAEGAVPPGTSITATARAADTVVGLQAATPIPVGNGAPFAVTGRFIEVVFTLRADQSGDTPVLSDVTIAPANQPPSAYAGGPYVGVEGAAVALAGAAHDPDGDLLTYSWSYAAAGPVDPGTTCTFSDPTALDPTFSCNDDGVFELILTVDDGMLWAADTTEVVIANAPPSVVITAPTSGSIFEVNSPFSLSTSISDPGSNDSHTCTIDWGDGAGAQPSACSTLHSYGAAGVYAVVVVAADGDGGSSSATLTVVVYDPNAGFVTGGGWFHSAAGSHASPADAEGKANFGFVAKYKKGSSVPTGQVQFQSRSGGLNLHSTELLWLVVTDGTAEILGIGTLNGVDGFLFNLVASEDEPERFRIKIWDAAGLAYDNQRGVSQSEPGQPIAGGNIVIHTKGKK